MSDNAGAKGPEPSDRVAIGITFGNSNSSIAYTVDDKAEVIANEDGGMSHKKLRSKEDAMYNFYSAVC
jgi:molecular chaperone DnaK (HSP70)